MPSELGKNQFA